MVLYKSPIFTISTLGFLLVACLCLCLAAPDSPFELVHSGKNYGENYGPPKKSGIRGMEKSDESPEKRTAQSNQILASEPGGGPFCPALGSLCIETCPVGDTPEALKCLETCQKLQSDCCFCNPNWKTGDRSWPIKLVAAKTVSHNDLTPKELRQWIPKTPAEICAEEATQCVCKCRDNGFEDALLQSCIELCKGYIDNCCTCGTFPPPQPTVL